MTTTRALCRVLSAVLQVPDVASYAARLVRDSWLPRAGEGVDEYDAAALMLAIAGAGHPSQASHVVKSLADLPLALISPKTRRIAPISPLDAIAAAIGDLEARPLTLVTVERGGICATVQGFVADRPFGRFYTATYGDTTSPRLGLRVFTEIPPVALEAVSAALAPQKPCRHVETMPSLATH